MKRRELLQAMAGGVVASGTAALVAPARVFAQAFAMPEQHRRLLDLARNQVGRLENVLWRTDIVGIADFGLPSSLPRLHFANLERGEVRSFLVAHGKGSDPEHDGFLKVFSNQFNSLATSRGAFVTGEWYRGKYGTSMRLNGIDPDNNNAYDRAIVMHPAWYANPDMLARYGKLGRSDGCFAMPEADFAEALLHLGAGRLLYADRLGLG
ncbi:murein L,D-transpeptidase catalytic domain-containing protein [Novosphingobium sp. FKTRR1]|uniref:murein L,D-transpeptidase catalytic domain-containing protein n=1 Tax=unclassified Novosphingobium TaxID=2644732 RepID=UPI001CF00923|nr:murein L,D-transpeptidase catalytic domain family protein [Novosphingobium sp. FKTRR1]